MIFWPCPLCKTPTEGVYCAACVKKAQEKRDAKSDPKKQN